MPAVRGKVVRYLLHRGVHLLVAEVPVANTVKVEISDIVAHNFALNLAANLDLSPAVVLLFKHVGSVLESCRDIVCLVA